MRGMCRRKGRSFDKVGPGSAGQLGSWAVAVSSDRVDSQSDSVPSFPAFSIKKIKNNGTQVRRLIRRAPRCATVLQIGELPIQAMNPTNLLLGRIEGTKT